MLRCLRLGVAIALMAVLPACLLVRAMGRASLNVEDGTIPPGFGQPGQVLLVVLMGDNKSVDEHTRAGFEAYRGPYRIVSPNDLASPALADMSKYRFVFAHMGVHTVVTGYTNTAPGHESEPVTLVHGGPGYSAQTARSSQFAMTDRKENKIYPGPTSSFFRAIIDAYVDRLNEIVAAPGNKPAPG